MFKYVATVAAVAASVHASEEDQAFKLKTFTSVDCSGTAFVDTTLQYGKCVAVEKDILVEELNDAKFNTLKFSPDAPNEFYMFTNKDACEEYGNSFNKNVEAAFIRSPGYGCKECKQCGNVKSVWTEKAEVESEKTETKVKEDSAASTVAISSAAVAAAVAAMFF